MRENDVILIADMCHNDSALLNAPKYLTYKAKNLPEDAGIKHSNSGRTFKVNDIIYASKAFITTS